MISTLTYLLLIQALASTTMERLPRPRSFTVSVACRLASIFSSGFFRSASQANLNNQVENININDSWEDPVKTSTTATTTTTCSNSICNSNNMSSQRHSSSQHHRHQKI